MEPWNAFLQGFNSADDFRRTNIAESEAKSSNRYRNLMSDQLEGQRAAQANYNTAMTAPNPDGLTDAQRQIAYWHQQGQPEKADEVVNQVLEQADKIGKMGDKEGAVRYVNEQLPTMKLSYAGDAKDDYTIVKSPQFGILAYNFETGKTKHIQFPGQGKGSVPQKITYKTPGANGQVIDVTEVYRNGSVEVYRVPEGGGGNAPKEKLHVKTDKNGRVLDYEWVDIRDQAKVKEAKRRGFVPVLNQDQSMGDPLTRILREMGAEMATSVDQGDQDAVDLLGGDEQPPLQPASSHEGPPKMTQAIAEQMLVEVAGNKKKYTAKDIEAAKKLAKERGYSVDGQSQ